MLSRLAGFYTVQLEDGRTVPCVLRGKVRKEGWVLAGDRVRVRLSGPGQGVIEAVLPRRTCLVRPPVANVNRLVAVAALARPEPDLFLLDRLLVVAEAAELEPLVCFNKVDLVTGDRAAELARIYEAAGYPVVVTSALTGQGVGRLAEHLRGQIATLGGASGVGKSALINALSPGARAQTGEVSEKAERGRHTTRMVRLLPLPGGGLLADTPGFSRLELTDVEPRRLAAFMPDLARPAASCQFGSDCLHRQEPGCAVREAVQEGRLAPSRYYHYLRFVEELLQMEARRYS